MSIPFNCLTAVVLPNRIRSVYDVQLYIYSFLYVSENELMVILSTRHIPRILAYAHTVCLGCGRYGRGLCNKVCGLRVRKMFHITARSDRLVKFFTRHKNKNDLVLFYFKQFWDSVEDRVEDNPIHYPTFEAFQKNIKCRLLYDILHI
jgi:hypothetical protein